MHEITRYTSKLNPTWSTGLDDMSPRVLKEVNREVASLLLILKVGKYYLIVKEMQSLIYVALFTCEDYVHAFREYYSFSSHRDCRVGRSRIN